MTEKITQEKVWGFIQLGDEDFDLEGLRRKFDIDAESSVFYQAIHRFLAEKKLRRLGRGRYHRVKQVLPVQCLSLAENAVLYLSYFSHRIGRQGWK